MGSLRRFLMIGIGLTAGAMIGITPAAATPSTGQSLAGAENLHTGGTALDKPAKPGAKSSTTVAKGLNDVTGPKVATWPPPGPRPWPRPHYPRPWPYPGPHYPGPHPWPPPGPYYPGPHYPGPHPWPPPGPHFPAPPPGPHYPGPHFPGPPPGPPPGPHPWPNTGM
ncbi:hypothetical protein Areg01_34270 [Actinoplanes regularis]|nr:hypothetical protein Areg01_34270 [Actinoplanes regularis]